MELHPLSVIIRRVIEGMEPDGAEKPDTDKIVEMVLANPEVELMRRGFDAHDRSEGLEDVFLRDVRRLVAGQLGIEDPATGGAAANPDPHAGS